eukprot:365406-Chlamydomonas_euryale.AAC.1
MELFLHQLTALGGGREGARTGGPLTPSPCTALVSPRARLDLIHPHVSTVGEVWKERCEHGGCISFTRAHPVPPAPPSRAHTAAPSSRRPRSCAGHDDQGRRCPAGQRCRVSTQPRRSSTQCAVSLTPSAAEHAVGPLFGSVDAWVCWLTWEVCGWNERRCHCSASPQPGAHGNPGGGYGGAHGSPGGAFCGAHGNPGGGCCGARSDLYGQPILWCHVAHTSMPSASSSHTYLLGAAHKCGQLCRLSPWPRPVPPAGPTSQSRPSPLLAPAPWVHCLPACPPASLRRHQSNNFKRLNFAPQAPRHPNTELPSLLDVRHENLR